MFRIAGGAEMHGRFVQHDVNQSFRFPDKLSIHLHPREPAYLQIDARGNLTVRRIRPCRIEWRADLRPMP